MRFQYATVAVLVMSSAAMFVQADSDRTDRPVQAAESICKLRERIEKLEARIDALERRQQFLAIPAPGPKYQPPSPQPPRAPDGIQKFPRRPGDPPNILIPEQRPPLPEGWERREFNGIEYYVLPLDSVRDKPVR